MRRPSIFFLIGVLVGAAGMALQPAVDWPSSDRSAAPVSAFQRYDDTPIILPIEAFGANWRIQRFRKNVLFPSGFDEAIDRAFKATFMLRAITGSEIEISLRPVTYRTNLGIPFPRGTSYVTVNGHGALLVGQ